MRIAEIEEWLDFRAELDVDCIRLSAALHPTESNVPRKPCSIRWPITRSSLSPSIGPPPRRVEAALKATGVGLSDLAYFDNMLHHDPSLIKKKHDFMMRTFETASLLGVNAVCGFVGRNRRRGVDQNLIDFEDYFIPLLKAAKERGVTFRVEQCPMPGWTTSDNFHNDIGYTPGAWIALHRICEKHGVGDQFRIHYDPSPNLVVHHRTLTYGPDRHRIGRLRLFHRNARPVALRGVVLQRGVKACP